MRVDEADDDHVALAIFEYESATLHALRVLEGTDFGEMELACQGFMDTLSVVRSLPLADREHGLALLLRRGRVPEHAWDVIGTALEFFHISDHAGLGPTVH